MGRSKILVPEHVRKKRESSLGMYSLDTEGKHWAQCFTVLGFPVSGSVADVTHCEWSDLSNVFAGRV